jgi:hypothetical protein
MRGVRRFATLLGVVALAAGCTSDRPGFASDEAGNGKSDGGNAGGQSGVDGSANGAASNPDDGINANLDASFDESCGASETREAERLDLDLFIMLDRSSSMIDPTVSGDTKWEAITTALGNFAADPDTQDIGIGLQYFPRLKAEVPSECRQDSECGANGPCNITGSCESALLLDGSECFDNTDCPFQEKCVTVGRCQNNQEIICAPADPNFVCGVEQGVDLGACVRWEGFCEKQDRCDTPAYEEPEIPILTGTDRGQLFIDSISSNSPSGGTPTAPALQGAIDYARAWAEGHPDRLVAVVLATDGVPSECSLANDVLLIDQVVGIARTAAEGSPALKTFVVGVFSPSAIEDINAPQNLNAIAEAGGTDSAYVINTDSDVLLEFYNALDSIRSSAAPACDFKLASDTSGSLVNYDLVNLQFTNDSGDKTSLYNVKTKAGCAANDDQGWYYVTELGSETPSQISVCPGVCEDFKASKNGRIELKIGCKTLVR